MKKILLSAAMFGAVITGINAQCNQAEVPTTTSEAGDAGTSAIFTMDFKVDGGHALLDRVVTKDEDATKTYIVGVEELIMKTETKYKVNIYTDHLTGGGRIDTDKAVFMDYDNDGVFEEVARATTADGKNTYHSFYFTTPAGISGDAKIRFVSTKAGNGDIYDCTTNMTIGAVREYLVKFPNILPPVAVNDIMPVFENTTDNVLDVLENDDKGKNDDGSIPEFTGGAITLQATNGTATVTGTTINYTPNTDFRGVDAFKYTVTTVNGDSNEAAVRVVVYGHKDIDGKSALIIEDFDTMDESVGGVVSDDTGYGWDGSFAWALNAPSGSKSDETSDVKAGVGAMLISINASPDAGITMDDTHTGNKVDLSNDATKLQFSAADNNNVMGMWVMPYEVYAGMKFGFLLKRVEAFDADGNGTPGDSYADKYISAYVDGADMTEWEFNFVGVDLNTLETEYKGAYILYKLRYKFDANASTSDFVIDEIGLYPATPLSNNNIELEGVSVYPNPVQNVLNIKAGSNATVTVLNTIGSKVYEGESKTISTQSWKKGLYFVIVKEGNASKTVKVIK